MTKLIKSKEDISEEQFLDIGTLYRAHSRTPPNND